MAFELLLLAGFATLLTQVPPPAPVGPVPSERQMAWQRLETYAFVHFGPNTFTDVEWGQGREDPRVFAPTALDTKQWVKAFKDAGFKAVILTAKHHDGFCLWPSKQSTHTVAQSSYKGDVLRELSDAVRAAGMKLGVYLSPWDRNHPAYGTPEYNEVFKAQLEEVLTQYGRVDEVWFDGANGEGPNGKKQVYDWPGFIEVVRKHAPNAVIFSDAGPDIRWVGNEAGYAGETNWSPLRRDEFAPGTPKYKQLTEGHEDGTHWLPAECDVSIRPGWFYHASQDGQVKSLEKLLDIYYGSVGRNGALLLNVPPDKRGLVHETDVARLKEFKQALDATFANDLAGGLKVEATSTRGTGFGAHLTTDGNPDTYWAAPDGTIEATLTIHLGTPRVVNRVLLQEAIVLGQRVRRFAVDARVGGKWELLAEGTTIGWKRILRTRGVEADAIRVRILDARACPTLASIELYAAPPQVTATADAAEFLDAATVTLTADQPRAEIRYSLDGSQPTRRSTLYKGSIKVVQTSHLRAAAYQGEVRSLWEAHLMLTKHDKNSLRAAVLPRNALFAGLRYEVFEQGWQSLSDLPNAKPTETGVCAVPTLAIRPRDEHFALRFTGYLSVPKDGIYTFSLASDDGSRLWIGEQMVIDHDGLHGMETKRGVIALAKGLHTVSLAYFNAAGGMGLDVKWSGPGFGERALSAADVLRG